MTTPNTLRVLIPLDSHEQATFQTALAYASAICERAGSDIRDVVLLVHTKGQLDSTSLGGFLGKANLKALNAGAVPLPGDLRLTLETVKARLMLARRSVIIAYYADKKLLDVADGVRNAAGVVAVPWVPGEADDWAARWGARVHGEEPRAQAALIEDPVVVRALEALTNVINLSTGLIHPSDKSRADETLRILRAKGHPDPTPGIKSWAIRQGWKPDYAGALETLSHRIWGLKGKPSIAAIPGASERYARWADGA